MATGDSGAREGRRSRARDSAATVPVARSGDFSHDPRFDPQELFAVVSSAESMSAVADAMSRFVAAGDLQAFERAIAVYVRSARVRRDPIETVLGTLTGIADNAEGIPRQKGLLHEETTLRRSVLRGILVAFYGDEVVQEGSEARERRREAIEDTMGERSGETWRRVIAAERRQGKGDRRTPPQD
jgi:hypothetical protein